jgi:Fe-S cluster assembly scaffold protein SufB
VADIELSHEAAVGKLAEEELEYLMARGLTRDEATSTIIKGFISMDVTGLPSQLAQELQRAIDLADQEGM